MHDVTVEHVADGWSVCCCMTSQKDDMLRTVGIYTDYVDTTDFDLMPDDKNFMIKVKVIACHMFLQHTTPSKNIKDFLRGEVCILSAINVADFLLQQGVIACLVYFQDLVNK